MKLLSWSFQNMCCIATETCKGEYEWSKEDQHFVTDNSLTTDASVTLVLRVHTPSQPSSWGQSSAGPPESWGAAEFFETAPNSQHGNWPVLCSWEPGSFGGPGNRLLFHVEVGKGRGGRKTAERRTNQGPSQGSTRLSRLWMSGLDSMGLLEEPFPWGSVRTPPCQMAPFFFLSITSHPL